MSPLPGFQCFAEKKIHSEKLSTPSDLVALVQQHDFISISHHPVWTFALFFSYNVASVD